jgi:hypothetical protein
MGEFAVNFWGSKPGTNDDCHTGVEFEEHGEAMDTFTADAEPDVAWLEIVGPTFRAERKNPAYVPQEDDDSAERSEHAMQAGMAFGCAGYNDAMGY